MNNPEVTMRSTTSNGQLIVLAKALEATTLVLELAKEIPAPMRSLADQLIRCSSSVAANLSEGHGYTGKSRLHHWRIAYASAHETDTFLHMLNTIEAIDSIRADQAIALFDEVRAMTWRLLNPIR